MTATQAHLTERAIANDHATQDAHVLTNTAQHPYSSMTWLTSNQPSTIPQQC